MSATTGIMTQSDARGLAPYEIEEALRTLWREATDSGDTALMHVRTLNLLIFVPAGNATPELLRAIDTTSVHHPGRTIVMLVESHHAAPTAEVAIACRIGGGGKQLCGERITITSGDNGAPLPNLAAMLRSAGVPTFVWWLGDPTFNTALFESLIETADRVIVDSRTWKQPRTTLTALAQATHQAAHTAYTDLQWTALTAWRRLTAQCFDLPDALPYLRQLQHVELAHGDTEQDRVAALLFLGWLASRLGWTVTQGHESEFVFRDETTPITVVLAAQPASRGLQAVHLASSHADIDLRYNAESMCITTRIALLAATPIERMARLQAQHLEQLVGEELDMLDRDRGFEAALAIAAQLAALAPA